MVPTLVVGDVVEVRLDFSVVGNSDKAFNILHYRVTSILAADTGLPAPIPVPCEPVLGNMALATYTRLAAGWKKVASANVGLMNVAVQKIHTGTRSEEYVYTPVEPVVGEIPGDSLPMQDAATMLKKTGIGERWGMGRLFVAGIPEDAQSNGRLLPLALPNYVDLGDAMMSNIGAAGSGYDFNFRPVLFAKEGATTRINDLTRVVLSNDVIKSQKRRRPGKGV